MKNPGYFSGICIWLNHNIFIFCLADFYIFPTAYYVFLHLFIAFGKESNMVFSDYLDIGREIFGRKESPCGPLVGKTHPPAPSLHEERGCRSEFDFSSI